METFKCCELSDNAYRISLFKPEVGASLLCSVFEECCGSLVTALSGYNASLSNANDKFPCKHPFLLPSVYQPHQSQVSKLQSRSPCHTLNGTYQGRYLSSFNQDLFLGVPFANSPRLNNPTSLHTIWSGFHDASEYGPTCYGFGSNTLLNLT